MTDLNEDKGEDVYLSRTKALQREVKWKGRQTIPNGARTSQERCVAVVECAKRR